MSAVSRETRLAPNFPLYELLTSEIAARHDIDMTPPPEVLDNLYRLCRHVLQPIRNKLGVPVIVTSGFRPPALNRLVGGSSKSQHMLGEAADIRAVGFTPTELWRRIEVMGLPIQQCILEFDSWVHVSVHPFGQNPAKQFMTALRRDGRTVYLNGLHA